MEMKYYLQKPVRLKKIQKKDVLLYGNADELEASQQQIYENDTLVSTYEEENDRRAVYVDEENQIQFFLSAVLNTADFVCQYQYCFKNACLHFILHSTNEIIHLTICLMFLYTSSSNLLMDIVHFLNTNYLKLY